MSLRGTRRFTALASIVALGLATASPAGAVGVPAETGVTSKTITLGMHLPLTGQAAAGYSDIAPATKAYFDYVNANGGINGRTVELKYYDNKYPSPADARKVVSQLVVRDKVFAMIGGLGTPTHGAVISYLNRARVPDTFVLSGSSGFNNARQYPFSFPGLPAYEVEAKIMAEYMNTNADLKGKRACLLTQKDDFGRGGEKGFTTAKFTFAAKGSYNTASAQADIQSQIVKFAQSGCQVVVVFGITSATGVAMLVAARAGFSPQWVSTAVGADLRILRGLQVPDSQLNNLHSGNVLPAPTDDSDPYMKQIRAILSGANVPITTYTVVAVNNAYLMAQAIKRAGKNPTRAGLVRQLNNISKFKTASLAPMAYSSSNRQGFQGLFMARYVNGVQVKQSDVYVTDAGSGAVTVSRFNRPAAPAKLVP